MIIFISALWNPACWAEPSAKIQGFLINADSMYRDVQKDISELEGHVQLVYQGQHISADRAVIHLSSRKVELFGNVEISDIKNTITGEQISLDYENNMAMIGNGSVKSGLVVFSGTTLQKLNESEYFVSDAKYTACTNCPAAWSFSGTSVRAQLGGYAYIKNALLRFGDVPVFWLPYLIVPLKSDRQSGLLTPSFEVSDLGGIAISLPYFWAISKNTDATIELKDYSRRGLKELFEYRYVLSEASSGALHLGHINDHSFGRDSRLNTFRDSKNQLDSVERWFLRYDHYLEVPDGGVHRTKMNLASDLQYPKDFPIETLNHGDSAMENRFSYSKNSKNLHYSLDSSYYINLLHANPLFGNDDSVHRLPELRFSQTQQNIGDTNFIYAVDLNFANYARAGNAYDDLDETTINGAKIRFPKNSCGNNPRWEDNPICHRTYDGKFDSSTDLIRTGQRIDFKPALYYPIKLGDGINLLPKLNYRETHYNFQIDENPSLKRRYIRTELSGRMNFNRIYAADESSSSTRYKHEILPEITYSRLPWLQQDDHPFFGAGSLANAPYTSRDSINDLDIGSDYKAQFDYYDRIYDRNLVTFAVINKLTQKRMNGDKADYRQLGYLKIAQSYDATQASSSGTNEPWSDVSATLDMRLDHFQTYSIFNYFPYQNVSNASSRVRLLNDYGQFMQVQLTRQFKITPGQPVEYRDRQEDYTFSGGFISSYLNLIGKVVYDANWFNSLSKDKVKSWAYIAQFKPPGECLLITFIHDQVTGGDTNFKLSFDFTFDGKPKPPVPPEALESYGF